LEKPMYACLQCGTCQEGKPYTHYYESGHYLAVNLFDLSVWCSECKAHFKDPSLETLGGKYKHLKGWSECFQVEYEKGTAPDGSQSWQVVSIREPIAAIVNFTLWNYMRMGESMARSNLLCTVDLSECNISLEALTVLFGRSYDQTWPLLEYLNLSGLMLGEEGMKIIEPLLSARTSLATLNLDKNSLGLEGIELLSNALNHVRVENLYLDDNGICDEGLESILISENAQYLNELWLCSNDIDNEGYGAVTQFLQNDHSRLKTLCLMNNCEMSVEVARSLADSLSKSSLNHISIGKGNSHHLSDTGILAAIQNFGKVVCNLEDFNSLVESNHQIRSFGTPVDAHFQGKGRHVFDALDINSREETSFGSRIRSKLRRFYFIDDFDINPFIELDAKLMPSLLELLTMSEEYCGERRGQGRLEANTIVLAQNGSFEGIYRLIRNYFNLQELFGYTSPEKKIKHLEMEIARLKEENAQLKGTRQIYD